LVALKFPRHTQLTDEEQEKFLREARAAAQLRHPHIVGVLDVGEGGAPGEVYLVTELLQGKTLYALCKESPLAPERAARLVVQLLLALEKAHSLEILHRDLKPGNLFVCETAHGETLKVLDYGLARAVDAPSLTKTGEILGTPAYMAPEQARGQRVDERTDIFAVGACLYAALSGRAPIAGESPVRQVVRAMAGGATPLAEVAPRVPAPLLDIVGKAMRTEPRERFASAREMRDALEGWLSDSREPVRVRRALRIAIALGLVLAAGGGGYLGVLRLWRRPSADVARPLPVVSAPLATREVAPLPPLGPAPSYSTSGAHALRGVPSPAPASTFTPCTRNDQCGELEQCYPGGCSCVAEAMRCGNRCRFAGRARNDCGCGKVCQENEYCAGSSHSAACFPCSYGRTTCGEAECLDLQYNERHCGACKHACAAGEQCHEGTCYKSVPRGSRCARDQDCERGLLCVGIGVCGCTPGTEFCDGRCRDDCSSRPRP
jgi:hypothetical protein